MVCPKSEDPDTIVGMRFDVLNACEDVVAKVGRVIDDMAKEVRKCNRDRKMTGDLARKLKELAGRSEWEGSNWEEGVAKVFEKVDLLDNDVPVKEARDYGQ